MRYDTAVGIRNTRSLHGTEAAACHAPACPCRDWVVLEILVVVVIDIQSLIVIECNTAGPKHIREECILLFAEALVQLLLFSPIIVLQRS